MPASLRVTSSAALIVLLSAVTLNPVAADATCCRLMGIDPAGVRHLQMASPLGNLQPDRIEQRGERTGTLMQRFDLLPGFGHLRGSL